MSRAAAPITAADEGMVRLEPLLGLADAVAAFGLSFDDLLDEVGLPHELFADVENTVPVRDVARLLALCAERTERPHFGLIGGQNVPIVALGPIGLLAVNAPDVRSALHGLLLTLHLNGHAVVPSLSVRDDLALFSLMPYDYLAVGSQQLADFAMALAFNHMRELVGADWVPSEVLLAHRAPRDPRPYRRFFRAPVKFDAGRYALLFPRSWLERPLPKADPGVRQRLEPAVASAAGSHDDDPRIKVRRAIVTSIVMGDVTVGRVAAVLRASDRTLNRQLAQHDSTIRGLIKDVRFRLARQLLSDTDLQMDEIGATLGYAETSTFIRAFHGWAGLPPAEWRSRQRSARASRLAAEERARRDLRGDARR